MININFWNFSKRKNSTALPSGTAVSYDCEIKEPSDLTSPQLLLNLGQSEAPAYTYAQIPAFSRYYFITEWRFDRGLWIASLDVDVLASYKTQIGSQSMYVTRSASAYDGTIRDMFYPTTDTVTESRVEIETFRTFGSGYYVIGILGDNGTTGGITYYQMPPNDFQSFVSQLFQYADGNIDWGDLTQGIINSVCNPMQYIVSCRWYPYPMGFVNTAVTTVNAGLWPAINLQNTYRLDGVMTQRSGTITLPKHPKASTRGSYMNLAPFTRYIFEFGNAYDLDTSMLANETGIMWTLTPDFTSTEAVLKVYAGSSALEAPIISAFIPYGVDVPLSQSATNPGMITDLAGGIVKSAAGTMTGELSALAAGASSLISAASDVLRPVISTTKAGGGLGTSLQTKALKAVFFDVVDDDLSEFGRPLMQTRAISSLNGYVRCQNDDIVIACLDSERERIRSYMTGGFFYE